MRRPLAYAKTVAARRRAGERVGLLVVSLHDWDAGKWFEASPEVCRVLLPDDLEVEAADWSLCLALDVLVCGGADEAIFRRAVRAVVAAGAVSCWGDFADGIHRLSAVGQHGVVAVDGPFPVQKLGAVLRVFRTQALALRIGGYASRVFDGARHAAFGALLIDLDCALREAA